MTAAADTQQRDGTGYRHDAVLYASEQEFLAATVPFVRAAIAANEPVLVATTAQHLWTLSAAIPATNTVTALDMETVGRNPARLISLLTTFLAEQAPAGGRVCAIGEPVYPGRSAAEIEECRLHEDLLNVAFDSATPLWLLCPYDSRALSGAVLDGAARSHPHLRHGETRLASHAYQPIDEQVVFGRQLAPAPRHARVRYFDRDSLGQLRDEVTASAQHAGLRDQQVDDVTLAVSELSTNSVRHGGGSGAWRTWTEPGRIVCDVSDRGHITRPLIGRLPPALSPKHGRGLWIANQLCDLVQIQSSPAGTTIRVELSR